MQIKNESGEAWSIAKLETVNVAFKKPCGE